MDDNKQYSESLDNINFDLEDLEKFSIEDPRERVIALRNTFFPRLQFLRDNTLELTRNIYGIDPYEGMSDFNSPNNRLDAQKITPPEYVYFGRTGNRRNSKKEDPLKILNAKGKPTYIHSAHLRYSIFSEGIMGVEFQPFSFSIQSDTVESIRLAILENIEIFTKNIEPLQICFWNPNAKTNTEDIDELVKAIQSENFGISKNKSPSGICFYISEEFPIKSSVIIQRLQASYIALYPLLYFCVALGNGKPYNLSRMLECFHQHYYESKTKANLLYNLGNTHELLLDDYEQSDHHNDNSAALEELLDVSISDVDERTKKSVVIDQRSGQQKFRFDLLNAYDSKCAFTSCDVVDVLEAAHIIPYKGEKTNVVENGLLLRSDIHRLFDKYLITINPDNNQIVISSFLFGTQYEALSDKKIIIPKNIKQRPSRQALQYHYRKFLER